MQHFEMLPWQALCTHTKALFLLMICFEVFKFDDINKSFKLRNKGVFLRLVEYPAPLQKPCSAPKLGDMLNSINS